MKRLLWVLPAILLLAACAAQSATSSATGGPSFAGPTTYRANRALREAARAADALLVETDAPYLAPEGHRGERNEPAYVALTYAAIAAERATDLAALAAAVRSAARELFGPRWEPTRL